MTRKQFTLYLENKAGMLARVTRMLARENVNIEGISISASTDVALVQVVVSNAAKTRRALRDAEIPYTVQDVALLPLENKPGMLSKAVAALARAGVNINYIYATGCSCQGKGECTTVVSAPDIGKVEEVWTQVTG